MSTFASTAMPSMSTSPARPGNVKVALTTTMKATVKSRFAKSAPQVTLLEAELHPTVAVVADPGRRRENRIAVGLDGSWRWLARHGEALERGTPRRIVL